MTAAPRVDIMPSTYTPGWWQFVVYDRHSRCRATGEKATQEQARAAGEAHIQRLNLRSEP